MKITALRFMIGEESTIMIGETDFTVESKSLTLRFNIVSMTVVEFKSRLSRMGLDIWVNPEVASRLMDDVYGEKEPKTYLAGSMVSFEIDVEETTILESPQLIQVIDMEDDDELYRTTIEVRL